MARFDVYRNPDGAGYLLNIQADLLSHLNTRAVVPLLPPDRAPKPARRLNPEFEIGGENIVMVTQFIAAVPTSDLPVTITNLAHRSNEIVNALDMLISGF
ncbi:MAG: plasmid maintenance protein CcdB [Rhodospirillales bacterium]|nr:plasmid maintenance protein CcdB [Rhodospirillales bacterium]